MNQLTMKTIKMIAGDGMIAILNAIIQIK